MTSDNPDQPLLDAIKERTRARIAEANRLAAERQAVAEQLAAPEPTERDALIREVAETPAAARSRAKATPTAAEPDPVHPPLDELTEAELARRVLAKRHLLPFVERFNPEYDAGWLHKVICEELEQFERDVVAKKSPRLILQVPPRHGKEIADSVPVLTADGWKTHGELRPGDRVFRPSGRQTEVLGVSEPSDEKVEVELSNGARIKCHPNHEWTVYDRTGAKPRWKTVETRWLMRRKLSTGPIGQRGGRYNIQLPPVEALQFDEAALPLDPYWFGLWLGDGLATDPQITSCAADAEVFRQAVGYDVRAEWTHPATGVVHLSFSRQGLRAKLRELGVHRNKHIPDVYKRGSIAQRLELMAGLVDADGHVERNTGRVRVVTVSKRLADDVHELAAGLGFRPYVTAQLPATSTSGIVGKRVTYTVGFQPTMQVPCRLERKQLQRLAPQRRLAVVAVRECAPEPGRCIQVAAEDGLYLVGRELIPTHNSQLVSVSFPPWFLGRNPQMEVIGASHTTSLSLGFSRKARGIVRNPAYSAVFPDAELSPDEQSAESWRTLKGGGYNAVGVGSAVVGKGAHVLIIDDPVSGADDAESAGAREAIKEWYQTEAYTRLAPGGGVLIIMQRWHDDDLAGWLQARARKALEPGYDGEPVDQFRVVHFPAIAEADEPYRRAGEALHPTRYPLPLLRGIKGNMTPRQWEALYQQNPVPDEGSYFTNDMFRFYLPEDLPELDTLRTYAAWDLAITQGERNDYTCGIAAGLSRTDDLYILDRQHGRWDAMEIVERFLNQVRDHKVQMAGMEKGHIQMTLGPYLNKRIAERKQYGFVLEPLQVGRRDKEARARSIQGRMQQGKVYLPKNAPWVTDFMRELLLFPGGAHDDQVDAIAHLGLMLDTMVRTQAQPPPKKKSWRDRLAGTGSNHRSAMSA